MYNTINREEIRRSRRWYSIPRLYVVGIVYQRRLLLISSLLMVLYTEISDQTFLYISSSRFWSIKSFNHIFCRREEDPRSVLDLPTLINPTTTTGSLSLSHTHTHARTHTHTHTHRTHTHRRTHTNTCTHACTYSI